MIWSIKSLGLFFRMPKIPKCGWFQICEQCTVITSRLITVKFQKKEKKLYACQKCRMKVVYRLLHDFHTVVIDDESAGEMSLLVY